MSALPQFPPSRLVPGEPIPYTFEPETPEEWRQCLDDALWRINSGKLYQVMTKTADDSGETIVPFKPNGAQRWMLWRTPRHEWMPNASISST